MTFQTNQLSYFSVFIFCSFLFFSSCKKSEYEYSIDFKLNPYNISPLTAQLNIKSATPCKVKVKVLGESPIEQSFNTISDSLLIPVLGLYANTLNNVEVTLDFETKVIVDTIQIKTNALPNLFPRIEINKLDRSKMEEGLHACDIHFANKGKFRSMPFIFDDQGKVRWYLDLGFHGKMVGPFQKLKDGTLLMVGRHTIYEFDMLGNRKSTKQIDDNYGMHHDVLVLSDDKLLACVGKRNAYINVDGEQILSDNDFIVLIDRTDSKILKEWDLTKHLDVARNDLNPFRPGDWLHMNALAFNEKDSSIVVSGRNQGLIKISWDDKLEWIMAPKKNWGKSGRNGQGYDTAPFLLTAVNSEGKAYSNTVQMGSEVSDSFEFPWGPHAPKLLPNGNILVFDNGNLRNFKSELKYSRAVEYRVNVNDKTVEQIWQYGKERGEELFSSIVSDADYLSNTKNILFTSGYVSPGENHSGKIVELNRETGEEVFEATLYLKSLNKTPNVKGWGQSDILYRSERLELKY